MKNPALTTNEMKALAQISHEKMGYRDAFFDLEDGFGVVALHHIKVTSRIDSYFRDLFSKKVETKNTQDLDDKMTVGVVQFLARDKNSKEITDFTMIWQKKYLSQPICVSVSKKLGKIAVGLDNGDIYLYNFDASNPKSKENIEEVHLPKAHSARVMKITFDEVRERLLSICDDKKLRVTIIKTKEAESSLKSFDKGLTDMQYNQKNQLLIAADSGNNIYTVVVNGNLPNVTCKVKLECEGPIRGLDVDWEDGYIFACSFGDGIISVLKSNDIFDGVSTRVLTLER